MGFSGLSERVAAQGFSLGNGRPTVPFPQSAVLTASLGAKTDESVRKIPAALAFPTIKIVGCFKRPWNPY